jgi:hypothetical protein
VAEREKQTAATNQLVVDLNAEVGGLTKKMHILTRSLGVKETEARAAEGRAEELQNALAQVCIYVFMYVFMGVCMYVLCIWMYVFNYRMLCRR